ncbi:hypothetical protein CHS0354_037984 [Potamilus streckersoni]|uniref:Uncharacterized protein n=1 Tax=Potamilus streckersoni TaxID=2493646 RepID=A0AAE0RQE8_9BIVA|nr:hypothetical protein CHS0354_037984 [Potamilus streckersoni]
MADDCDEGTDGTILDIHQTSASNIDEILLIKRLSKSELILRLLLSMCISLTVGLMILQVELAWQSRELLLQLTHSDAGFYDLMEEVDVTGQDEIWSWDPVLMLLKQENIKICGKIRITIPGSRSGMDLRGDYDQICSEFRIITTGSWLGIDGSFDYDKIYSEFRTVIPGSRSGIDGWGDKMNSEFRIMTSGSRSGMGGVMYDKMWKFAMKSHGSSFLVLSVS